MRFCDFFIEYVIGLKKTKSLIPWTKLPFYRKIFVIITFIASAITIILGLLQISIGASIGIGIIFLLFLVFTIIDASKRNLREMLDNHYTIYSRDRMLMLKDVFSKYELDISDEKIIDLLIDQAEKAKVKNDPILPIIKPIKTLGAIIIPIVIYVAKKITETSTQDDLIYVSLLSIAIILCIASILFALRPIIRDIVYRDYNKYGELIYDLNQLKIFYK